MAPYLFVLVLRYLAPTGPCPQPAALLAARGQERLPSSRGRGGGCRTGAALVPPPQVPASYLNRLGGYPMADLNMAEKALSLA